MCVCVCVGGGGVLFLLATRMPIRFKGIFGKISHFNLYAIFVTW